MSGKAYTIQELQQIIPELKAKEQERQNKIQEQRQICVNLQNEIAAALKSGNRKEHAALSEARRKAELDLQFLINTEPEGLEPADFEASIENCINGYNRAIAEAISGIKDAKKKLVGAFDKLAAVQSEAYLDLEKLSVLCNRDDLSDDPQTNRNALKGHLSQYDNAMRDVRSLLDAGAINRAEFMYYYAVFIERKPETDKKNAIKSSECLLHSAAGAWIVPQILASYNPSC